jgi:hypothetical protein
LLEETLAATLAVGLLGVVLTLGFWLATGISPWPGIILGELVGLGMGIPLLALTGHRMLELVTADVSPEVMAAPQPGVALPIGCIYAHAVGLEDLYIQQLIQHGQPLLWERDAWAARLGHELPPNQWNVQRVLPPDYAALADYRAAVFAQSRAYVASLGSDAFDAQLQFPGRDWSMSIGQLLAVTVAHTLGHAGEIAALRGALGHQALPF